MLKLSGRACAYNVQKVAWLLDELGLAYESIDLGGSAGGLTSEAFLAMNPNGRIPVLEDGDLCIWESNTILRYLAASYGSDAFWPCSVSKRTDSDRWMDWELATLQPDFIGLFWGYYRMPAAQRDIEKVDYFRARCEKNVKILEYQLTNRNYLAGDLFGLADICVGTSFYRYLNMGLSIQLSPAVSDWYQSLCSRAAYKKVIMTPFDALKGRVVF